jgi:hypothetical protein
LAWSEASRRAGSAHCSKQLLDPDRKIAQATAGGVTHGISDRRSNADHGNFSETFYALGHEPVIREFQVQQTQMGAHILIQAEHSFNRLQLTEGIRQTLELFGIAEAEIPTEFVDRIPRSSVGKLRRFVGLTN